MSMSIAISKRWSWLFSGNYGIRFHCCVCTWVSDEGKTIKSHEIYFVIPCCNEIGFYYYPLSTTSSLSSAAGSSIHSHALMLLPCCCYLVAVVLLFVVIYFWCLCAFHQNKTLCVFCVHLSQSPELKLKDLPIMTKEPKWREVTCGKFFPLLLSLLLLLLSLEKQHRQKRKVFSIS